MKNTIKLLGFIAVMAIMGFSFIACDDGSKDDNKDAESFDGTWVSGPPIELKLVAENGSFKQYMVSVNKEVVRGTYTYSGNNVTAKITEVNTALLGGEDKWTSYADLGETEKVTLGAVLGGTDTLQIVIVNNAFTIGGIEFKRQ
jgi:uncharacterized lipoprotein YehR (DUF1307 family)